MKNVLEALEEKRDNMVRNDLKRSRDNTLSADHNDASYKRRRKEIGKPSTDFGTNRVLVSDNIALKLTEEAKANYITYQDIKKLINNMPSKDETLKAALANEYTRQLFKNLGYALKDKEAFPNEESKEKSVKRAWRDINEDAKKSPATREILQYFSKLSEKDTADADAHDEAISFAFLSREQRKISKGTQRHNELQSGIYPISQTEVPSSPDRLLERLDSTIPDGGQTASQPKEHKSILKWKPTEDKDKGKRVTFVDLETGTSQTAPDRPQERLRHDVAIKHKTGEDSNYKFRVARTNELNDNERNEPGIHLIYRDVQVYISMDIASLKGNEYKHIKQIFENLNEIFPNSVTIRSEVTILLANVRSNTNRVSMGKWYVNIIRE